MKKTQATKGFTLVELLIVIVVIAILAAITLVSYNGIQKRAKNTAIISAASQSMTLIRSYIALEGKYPLYGETACLTDTSGCAQADEEGIDPPEGDADLTAALTEIGTLPRSVPISGSDMYGIMYSEKNDRKYDGNTSDSAVLFYYLNGVEQDCGVSRVADSWDNTENGATIGVLPSTDRWTAGDYLGSGKTMCIISIPGP